MLPVFPKYSCITALRKCGHAGDRHGRSYPDGRGFSRGSPSFWLTAILPGILCGLTAAGKYTYVGILFPAILAIWLFGKRWRFYRTLVLVLASVGAFICVVPYSLLDINAFVEELGKLAASYARGRVGRIYEPGWDHARQYILFALKDIGPYSLFLAILGMVYGFLKNWRGALIMGLFPCFLWPFECNSYLYERNAMFSYLYYGLLVAVGLFAAGQFIFRVTGKIARIGSRNILRTGIAVAAVCLLAWSILPLGRQRTMFAVSPDTKSSRGMDQTERSQRRRYLNAPGTLFLREATGWGIPDACP